MNKKAQYIAMNLVFILLVLLAFWYLDSRNNSTELTKGTMEKRQLCFAKLDTPDSEGRYDKYTLKMDIDADQVTGELKFMPREKDSKTGTFEGTISVIEKIEIFRLANVIWDTYAEGMNTKEELRIKFGEGVAYVGFGEMSLRGDGVYGYKDSENIIYSLQMTDIACGDISDNL